MAHPGYRCEQQDDGKWTIYDVEVFAAAENDGEPRGASKAIDKGWLRDAIKRAAQRRTEGYLPPLHIQHHDEGEAVEDAGHFVLTKVKMRKYDGEMVPVLYATFVDVPDHVHHRIASGRLSYRSVEILKVKGRKPEIDSIALMAHTVPYFRFPLLRLRAPAEKWVDVDQHEPVLAYRAGGDDGEGAQFAFKFEPEERFMQAPPVAPEKKEAPAAPAAPPAKPEAPAAEEPTVEEAAEDVAEAPGIEEAKAAMVTAFTTMTSLITQFTEQLTSQFGIEVPAEAAAPGQPPQPPAAAPVAGQKPVEVQMSAADKPAEEVNVTEANLAGRFDALEEKYAALQGRVDAQAEAEKLAAGTASLLEEMAAYALSEASKTKIKTFAKEKGLAYATAYANGLKDNATLDPPHRWRGDIPANDTPDGDDVLRWQEFGPDALAKARTFAARFNALPKRARGSLTQASFVETSMRSAGFGDPLSL
jgi:hypothetical protein